MGPNGNTRQRPLLILRLLMENSDEAHPVTMDDILTIWIRKVSLQAAKPFTGILIL